MPDPTCLTPGVYVTEVSTTLNAIEPVPTAIPAFIGYAPKVEQGGVSYLNKVRKVLYFK
jgi:phage tail sheath protein FI